MEFSVSCENVWTVNRNKNLIYKEYLGDGATLDVVNSDPYEEHSVVPVMLECVGHVQKRLGTRLRNLVKAHKNAPSNHCQAEAS